MAFLTRVVLAGALLAAFASPVFAADETLCILKTSFALPKPKDFKVVELDKKGNGNGKAEIGRSSLPTESELKVGLDGSGDISSVTLAGVLIPIGKLFSSGVAVQVSQLGFSRDIIKMTASKTETGYVLNVTTITSAGLIHNPTRKDAWRIEKDSQGKWGVVVGSAPDGKPEFAEAITADLTLNDPKDPSQGFKGITDYVLAARPRKAQDVAISTVVPVSQPPDEPVAMPVQ